MTSETTPQVFMSYTRADDDYEGGALTRLREQLERAIRALSGRSIRIFQDVEGINLGQNIQQRIAESLNETFLLLPIITPSYLTSDWCREEFQRFLQRERALGRNDLIIPIYYLDVPRLSAAMQHPARAQPSDDAIINELAPRLAADWRHLRGQADDVVRPESERIAKRIIQVIEEVGVTTRVIGLFSYPPAGPGTSAPTQLAWNHHFPAGPDVPDFWQTTLPHELSGLRATLGSASVKHLTLYARAHLSVGVAFGYTFRATTGFNLSIEQRGQWWHTDACPADALPLTEEVETIDPTGNDLTVEISAVRDQRAEAGVNKWIQETQPSLNRRLHLFLPHTEQDEVRDAAHALAIACQVRAAILRARQQHLPTQTHLFGVMPLGLAALIGWLLNACEPIQCYDFDRNASRYVPTCRLTQAFAQQTSEGAG
jgi:hypothetical protein